MEIQIDPHTLERAEERGASEEEIREVINTGTAIPVRYGRMGKAKTYDFKQQRHGRYYDQKKVEVFYTIEGDVIAPCTSSTESGKEMQIHYNPKKDLLYIRLDERKQEVVNRRPSEDIVLDIGEGDRLVGIEIMDASKHLDVESLLPVKYQVSP